MPVAWDYLIVTASNDAQASAYEAQLGVRRKLGLLTGIREAMVVADHGGKRVGSGGSTVHCLKQVLARETEALKPVPPAEEVFRRLRILIIHAGGDSKRLPAYGPCGKIFVPVPGESSNSLGVTLFDRLAPPFLALPPGKDGAGQLLVTSGDALLLFDSSEVRFTGDGMTALGCYTTPEEAARHGVFCVGADGAIRLYLQKPPIAEQAATGAITREGKTALDVGIMSFDGAASATLLRTFGGREEEIMARELDLYREICCAMGGETTLEHYLRNARSSGTRWHDSDLTKFYPALRAIPFHIQIIPQCDFLHFGATRELTPSGLALIAKDGGAPSGTCLSINNEVTPGGAITGTGAWVEGCRIGAPLTLGGRNVVIGVDVDVPLVLPENACVDVLEGQGKWFVRCYGVNDAFKDDNFCGKPLVEWLTAVGAKPEDVWDSGKRTLWDARIFPAVKNHSEYRNWLWMFQPEAATPEQKRAFLAAERHSTAEIALLTDQNAFYQRRIGIRSAQAAAGGK
jgi:fucokinase